MTEGASASGGRRGRLRPMPVVPAGRRSLPLVVAPMLFLATLAMALVLTIGSMLGQWQSGLQGTATVEVPSAVDAAGETTLGLGSAAARRQDRARLDAVLAVLRASPLVTSARPLEQEELVGLVDPWIDSTLLLDDLPIPALIDVQLSGDGGDIETLAAAVAAAAPGARLDTHQQWLGELEAAAGSIRVVGLFVVLVAVSAAIATVIVVTRAELMIHQRTIAILHVMGATDAYIARQFQVHALRSAGLGALIGVAGAVLTLVGLTEALGGGAAAPLPGLSLAPLHWVVLCLLFPLAALVAATTARVTVLNALIRLP